MTTQTQDRRRDAHRAAPSPAELAKVEGEPLPLYKLVQIWASLPEDDRLGFLHSLDERIADRIVELCARRRD